MRAIIVASGPSAEGFDPPDDAAVIAVNGVIDWIRRADYWFTLDPSRENLRRMRLPVPGVEYCAAIGPDSPRVPNHVRVFERVSSGKRTDWRGAYSPEWWFDRWQSVAGISKVPGKIHTGNSAWGAVQLAYQLGFRQAILIGVDASKEPRIEGGLTNDLSHLPLLFDSIGSDMDVINCGSMQCSLPKMTISEGLTWLTK